MIRAQSLARRVFAFVVSAMALAAGERAARAFSFFWVGDDNNVWSQITGPGGTNWSSSGDFNNGTSGVPGSGDNVFFVLNGAGNLNTELGTNFSINSLTFTADATNPVQINDAPGTHLLTIGAGGITNNGPSTYTMNAPLLLGAAETWSNNSTANPLIFNSVISGAASNNLTLAGNGTFTFTGANTYSGSTSIFTGGLTLNGNGSILNTTSISLNSGTSLILDNSAGTNLNNRISSSTGIASNGGILTLIGNGSSTSQTVGTLSLGAGASVVRATGNGVLTLGTAGTIPSLSRSSGGTINFVVDSGANVKLPNATVTNGIIGGYAVTGTTGGTGLNWATLDGSKNVVPYTSYTQLTANANGSISSGMTGTAQATNNIQYNANGGVSPLITADTTINTLYITGGSQPISTANIAAIPAAQGTTVNGHVINFSNGITFGSGNGSQANATPTSPGSAIRLTIGAGGIISSGATGTGYFNNKESVLNMGFVGYLFGEYNTTNSGGTTTDIGEITVSPGVPDLVAYTDSNLRLSSLIVDTPVNIAGTTNASLTSGSNIVTLTGTATTAQLAVGMSVRNLSGLPNGVQKITGITDATHFTIATVASASSTTGQAIFGTSIGLTKSGPGILDLSNGNAQTNKPSNLFTGKVTINEGVVLIGQAQQLGGAPAAADDVTFNGGELRSFAGFSTTANQGWTVGTRGGIFSYSGGGTANIQNKITGVGGFTIYSRGIGGGNGMTINLANNPANSGGANDYQGPTNLIENLSDGSNASSNNNAGTIGWSVDNQIPAGSAVTMNEVGKDDTFTVIGNSTNVAVNINGHSDHFGSLAGNLNIRNFNGTLTLGANNLSTEWDGSLYGNASGTQNPTLPIPAGTGRLVKVGTGTQIFGGTLNNYTGATSINGGALLIGTGTGQTSNASLTGSTVNVGDGATLVGTLGGNGTINGNVNVSSTGHLAPAMSASTFNTLTLNGNLTLSNGATLDYNFGQTGAPGQGDLVNVIGAGNLTLNAGLDILNITQIPNAGFGIGTYPLLSLTGTGVFTDSATFAVNGKTNFNYVVLPPGAAIDPSAGGGTVPNNQLYLEVLQGNPNITWIGNVNDNWDINTSANWSGDASTFTNGANVTFDDFVTGSTNITVAAGGVIPAAITFANGSHDYTISGDSVTVTSGSGIVKNQGGAVTFNSNVTTPATTINGGSFAIGSTSHYVSTVKLDLNGGSLAVNGSLTTGNLAVKAGTSMSVSAGGSLGSSTAVNVAGTATFNNAAQTLAGLSGVGSTTLNGTALTLAGNSTYLGTLGGTGSLTVSAGTVALSGANTYGGGTTVNGGTLLANNLTGSATGAGAVVVNTGAALGGTGIISGGVTINSGGILSPATAGTIGALTLGATTLSDGAVLNYDFSAPGNGDTGNITGNLSLAGTQTLNITSGANFGKAKGSYPLFTATGGVTNNATFAINATGPAANYVYGVTTTSNQVLLTVSFIDRTWTGATADGIWDFTTPNWSPDLYKDGYEVTFDDTANNKNVSIPLATLPTGVAPAGVIFNNSQPYTVGTVTVDGTPVPGGPIAGTGSVTLNGPGTVTFTNPNTYTGGTVINNGTLIITNGNQLGTAPATAQPDFVVINGGTLQLAISLALPASALNGNRGFTVGPNGGTIDIPIAATGTYNGNTQAVTYYPGVISGAGNLTITGGSGTNSTSNPYIFETDAHNQYGGTTTVNNAILEYFGGAGSTSPTNVLPATTVLNLINNGWFNLNDGTSNQTIAGLTGDSTGRLGTSNTGNAPTFNIAVPVGQTYTFPGVVGDLAILDKTGSVALPLNITGFGTQIFTGNNTYTGTTTISGGFFQLGTATTVTHSLMNILSENGLQFSPGIGSFVVAGLGGTGNEALVDTAGQPVNVQTGNDNAVHTYSGSLSGGGSITKIGTGTQNLNNPNFNTGPTVVNAGTLQLNFGATATGTMAGSPTITVNSGATLALNAQDAVGTTPGISAITINGGTVSNISTPAVHVSIANTVNMTGGTFTSTGAGDASGSYALVNAGFNATSDASGNPAIISGGPLGIQSGNATFNVARGTASPASDLNVSASINPVAGATGGLVKSGTGVMTLSSSNTYTGSTTISGGTLRLVVVNPLVAHFSFDNVSGTTVVNDGSAGAALNGTINSNGGNSVTIAAGKFGNGATFANDQSSPGASIDIPLGASSPIDLAGNGTWSASLWMMTGEDGDTLFSKNDGTANWAAGNSLFYLTNGTTFGSTAGAVRNGGAIAGTASIDDGSWHMVTFVASSGTRSIYVDGVEDTNSTDTFTAADVGNVIRLGLRPDGAVTANTGAQNLNGSLDEVYFFNQALTPEQIQGLFATNTFAASTASALPSNTPVNITASGAVLDVNGVSQTIGSLAGVAGSQVALGGGSLTVGADGANTIFAGNITDSGSAKAATGGSLTKVGIGTLALNGNDSYTGATTISNGTLAIGRSYTASSSISIAAGTLNMSANGGHVLGTAALSIDPAAMFDLADNDFMMPYTGVTPAAAIRTLLITGRNGGTWNGIGGIDSSAAVGDASHLTALGYGEATDLGITSIDGVAVTGSAVIVKYTYIGDSSLDGKVDLGNDFNLFIQGFLNHGAGWELGDYNYDGVINTTDFGMFVDGFKAQGGSLGALESVIASSAELTTAQRAAFLSIVPEPSSMMMLVLGATAFAGRRRR